ncbi:hypothetical protein [Sporosarcina aquimarina]|uniref:hypothetical protein n=1 Tax=Sporosarcina aquimarina TaxID=114975 RepID=UPI001C8D7B01|nr:hypothetical protein [Sporosarcina aquimarina]MBY0221952.1 hypothetical protein [Sporosarcina aquimarina]
MNKFTGMQSLKDAFNSIAVEVLINDEPQQAYITQAHLGESSRKHMHSLQPFNQGDYVSIGEAVYMVVEDVVNQRGAKYKATIQHCNYMIQLPGETIRVPDGVDSRGRPKYKEIVQPGKELHSIVNMDRVTMNGSQIVVNTSVYMMLIPDIEEARENVKVNDEYDVYGEMMVVVNINRLRTGLMEITLKAKL